ncbi:hypothetical protein GOP47_0006499 [Adiantum capillus-veneris]|uniref:Uncharacterized protein n=1 Tax=Adiantum capillus-veneris TaxID=13818 RepID=A0A9D4V3Z7_ADICA|nr:hypothetical protein GOP47_0006499 [Adiantum capillus-veneris]
MAWVVRIRVRGALGKGFLAAPACLGSPGRFSIIFFFAGWLGGCLSFLRRQIARLAYGGFVLAVCLGVDVVDRRTVLLWTSCIAALFLFFMGGRAGFFQWDMALHNDHGSVDPTMVLSKVPWLGRSYIEGFGSPQEPVEGGSVGFWFL